jgi:hypothetical protein
MIKTTSCSSGTFIDCWYITGRHLPDIAGRHVPDIAVRHVPDIVGRHVPEGSTGPLLAT